MSSWFFGRFASLRVLSYSIIYTAANGNCRVILLICFFFLAGPSKLLCMVQSLFFFVTETIFRATAVCAKSNQLGQMTGMIIFFPTKKSSKLYCSPYLLWIPKLSLINQILRQHLIRGSGEVYVKELSIAVAIIRNYSSYSYYITECSYILLQDKFCIILSIYNDCCSGRYPKVTGWFIYFNQDQVLYYMDHSYTDSCSGHVLDMSERKRCVQICRFRVQHL